MSNYFRNKYNELLDTILSAEELVAVINSIEKYNTGEIDNQTDIEEREDSADIDQHKDKSVWNKELMTKMLSSLLNVSLTKLKNKNELDLLANEELYNYLNKNNEYLNKSNIPIDDDEPFLALFLDKLITRLVPERLPLREKLIIDEIGTNDFNENDLGTSHDESEQQVSVGTLASNIHKLSGSMEAIFEFQDTMIRILSWKMPSKMIMILLILTKICYNPMYIILFPLLYLSLGVIVNNYNIKYNNEHLYSTSHRSKIGKSLFTDLFKYDPSKTTTATQLSTPQEITHGMQVVLNIRDFQNLTTNQLHLLESSSKFLNETAAFQDERKTTILLLGILLLCITLKVLSIFLNWSFVLSSALWLSAIIIHPKLLPKLKLLYSRYSSKKQNNLTHPVVKHKHFDMVLDQQPRTHTVEIFEIYREGLIPTTWKFFIFSSSLFDPSDQYRKTQKPPPGVKELTLVQPPKGWIFDPNDDWKIDYNFNKWKKEKNLQVSIKDEFLIDSNFKRRRLTRRVIQSPLSNK